MVEQGIYFALGSIVTALAAMMFAPVFWRRALRLTRKRLQLQVPLSMQEILAERDQLRADFAVERLKIEQAIARVQEAKAESMAVLGRRTMETEALRSEVETHAHTIEGQKREMALMTESAGTRAGELASLRAALDEATAEIQTWRGRAQAAAEEQDRLRDSIEGHRATIAGLETRAMGLEMRLTDAERSESSRLKATEEGLRTRLETAMGQATRHETSAISLRRECDEAKAHVRALERELEALRGRTRATQLESSLKAGHARRAEAAGPASETSDEELRASIHALGLAVAMMSRRAARREEEKPARADPSPAGVE